MEWLGGQEYICSAALYCCFYDYYAEFKNEKPAKTKGTNETNDSNTKLVHIITRLKIQSVTFWWQKLVSAGALLSHLALLSGKDANEPEQK